MNGLSWGHYDCLGATSVALRRQEQAGQPRGGANGGMAGSTINNHAAFIWSVADLLRGDYKQSEYGKVILPLTVIRRLDCVLEPTKQAVLKKHKQLPDRIENIEMPLQVAAGQQFFNKIGR